MIFFICKLYKIYEILILEYEKKNGVKRWGLYVKELYIGIVYIYVFMLSIYNSVCGDLEGVKVFEVFFLL